MSDLQPIRVLLVDDHTMVRRGLATFLQVFDDLELVGEATNGWEAVEHCAKMTPHVVLMDMLMPEMDGAEATYQIRQQFPDVQVLVLTSFKEDRLIQAALKAGAIGYLLKDVSADDLAQAIRAAHAGRATLAPEAVQVIIQGVSQPQTADYALTAREQDVLTLLVQGLNNTQIATALFVSPSTIKSHVSHILQKLAVSSRTEAAALAVRQRLVI